MRSNLYISALLFVFCTTTLASSPLPSWYTARRIIGSNNLDILTPADDSAVYNYARVVALVETITTRDGFCTASRVGENLFLTNYHCYEAVACENMQFTMGYEEDAQASDRLTFTCKRVVHKKLELDFALFEALPTDDRASVDYEKFPILPLWEGTLEIDMALMVASHPSSRSKEVDSSDECRLVSTEVEEFYYRRTLRHKCDTEGGSSGAPIIDLETGFAIGLHWGGHNAYNFCIPIKEIIDDLRRALPADIIEEMLIME